MCTDFVLQVKFTIFWLNRGLRVYLDLYASDFPKSTSQYFLHPSTFKSQTPYFGGFIQILHPKMTHCCEAPRSMLSNYFVKIQVLQDNFGKIWRIQIHIYPQTSIEPKYGEFYLKNEVSAHGLVLLVQLS